MTKEQAKARREALGPVAIRALNSAYYIANRVALMERARLYRKTHPEARTWADRLASNPNARATAVLSTNRRRAIKRGSDARLTAAQWREILGYFGNRCAYCLANGPMTQDHIVPISNGGAHTADNVVPACGPCNRRKGARTPVEVLMAA